MTQTERELELYSEQLEYEKMLERLAYEEYTKEQYEEMLNDAKRNEGK